MNVSPKGMDSLRVVGPNELLWLNLTGSGNETAAHLRAANRVTMMWPEEWFGRGLTSDQAQVVRQELKAIGAGSRSAQACQPASSRGWTVVARP